MTKRSTGIHAENVNLLLRTLRQMSDEMTDELRSTTTGIADAFLRDVVPAARTPQQNAAASAFKVYRDRVPKVGFTARAATGVSGGARAGELFYGAEFSKGDDWRFPDSQGGFFYPTLRHEGEGYAEDWFATVMDLLDPVWNKAAAQSAVA